MKRNNLYIFLLWAGTALFAGCANNSAGNTTNTSVTSGTENLQDSNTPSSGEDGTNNGDNTASCKTVQVTEGINTDLKGEYSDNALDSSFDENDATVILLNKTSAQIDGNGARFLDGSISITEKGTYILRGTLDNGQVVIDLDKNKNVHLVLDNADISCSYGPAIQLINAKNLYLTLADGSKNSVSDGSTYKEDASGDNPDAAIFSQEDLIINGSGNLTVTGNYKDGITSKDDLTIVSGNISVNAVDDALTGKDRATLREPVLDLSCGGDGIKSNNTKDTKKGVVIIDGGQLSVKAGDDGIHSETALVINDGIIDVKESTEGLESLNIVINKGDISIVSSDDGINISGGNDTASTDIPARGMGGGMDTPIDGALIINGGSIYVNAEGDGLDSNGGILINDGNIIIAGPSGNGNGAFDYNGTFELDGGTVFAYGSPGMAQISSDCSAQTFITASDGNFQNGDEITIYNENGGKEASYTFDKEGAFIFYSSGNLEKDKDYTLEYSGNKTQVTAGDGSTVQAMGKHGGMGGGQGRPGMDDAGRGQPGMNGHKRPEGMEPGNPGNNNS